MMDARLAQIDREAATPYYQQLAHILQSQIEAGQLRPNDRLPSESDLCRTFDLSRSTVRETLRSLQEQRLIRMVPRRGAFVAGSSDDGWTLQVTRGFLEVSAEQSGRHVETRVLRAAFEPLPDDVCGRLDLPSGATGFALERVRSLDGTLVMHSTNYLPEEIGRQIEGRSVLRGEGSLNRTLQEIGIVIQSARRDLVAVAAPKDVAKSLGCPKGHPLLLVESLSVSDSGRPFDCYYSYVRTDRLKISIEARAAEEK
jgi:GntR family transcriptional regulator